MDHTLIIPTKNRPSWLFFALNCLKEFNYKGKIVIIDVSKEVKHSLNNQYLEKFKILSIYKNSGKIIEKYLKILIYQNTISLKILNTKYFTIMNDDDCFFRLW